MIDSRRLSSDFVIVAMLAAMSGPAWASEPPTSAAPEGLAPSRLHVDAWLGLAHLDAANGHGDVVVSGVSTPLGLSAGVSVTRRLVVFGEISDNHMLLFDAAASYDHTSLDLYGAGLGLKAYVTPQLFVSAAGAVTRLRLGHQAGGGETSQWGVGARVSAGREWAVSPKWSVGLGVEYQYGLVQTRGLNPGLNDPLDGRYSFNSLSLFAVAAFHQPAAAAAESFSSWEIAAGPAGPRAGFHTHDGFYLGAGLGPVWLRARNGLPNVSGDRLWSGLGTSLGVSAGYALAQRFVVFGEFSESQARNASDDLALKSIEWSGFGPGLRYYLMPANVFFSGALLLSKLSVYPGFGSRGFDHWTSDWGGVGQVAVGKEWWVLSDVGLGVAAMFAYGKVPATDGWLASTFDDLSIVASVSYN